jgi:hypothetical protein
MREDYAESSGDLLPPPPPAKKAAARQDQAGQVSTRDGAGNGRIREPDSTRRSPIHQGRAPFRGLKRVVPFPTAIALG